MPVIDAPAHAAPAHHAPAHHHAKRRLDRLERGIVHAVNRARARRGLPRVGTTRRLSFIATIHAADMARHRVISHSSSNGTPFDVRIRTVDNARTVGETLIALPPRATGREVVRAWLRSPGHRAQVLNPRYRKIGVGRVTRDGLIFVTADFASAR